MANSSRKRPAPAPAPPSAPARPGPSQLPLPKKDDWTAEQLLARRESVQHSNFQLCVITPLGDRAALSRQSIANPPQAVLSQGQPMTKRLKQTITTRGRPTNPSSLRSFHRSLSNHRRSPELGDAQPPAKYERSPELGDPEPFPSRAIHRQRSPELGDPELSVRTALCNNNRKKPSQPANTTSTPIANNTPLSALELAKWNAILKEFHQFQKELHTSFLNPLNFVSFFFFHIAEFLGTADIVNLSSISSSFDAAERQADHWDIDLALNDFFGHARHNFRKVLRQTDSFVAGPFALRYFSHCDDYRVPMNVYVERRKTWSHLRHYLVKGQGFCKVGEDEFFSQDRSINRVHLFQYPESNATIRVFTTLTPIDALLRSVTDTSMLNIITSDRAYCLFPRATILNRELYRLKPPELPDLQSPTSLPHAAWEWEGSTINTRSVPEPKEFGKEFTDDRRIGDKHTWIIKFDHDHPDQNNGRQPVIEEIEHTAFEMFQQKLPERLTAPTLSAPRTVPRASPPKIMCPDSDQETELSSIADGCEEDYRVAEYQLRQRKGLRQPRQVNFESPRQANPMRPAVVNSDSESDAESVFVGSQLDHQRAEAARKQIREHVTHSGQSTGEPSSSGAARPAPAQKDEAELHEAEDDSSTSAAMTFAHLAIAVRRHTRRLPTSSAASRPAASTQPETTDSDTDGDTESVVESGELPHMLAEAGQRAVTRSTQMDTGSPGIAAARRAAALLASRPTHEHCMQAYVADPFAAGMLRMMPPRVWNFIQECYREKREREGVLALSNPRPRH